MTFPLSQNLPVQEWVDAEPGTAERLYREALEGAGLKVTWIETHYTERSSEPFETHVGTSSESEELKDVVPDFLLRNAEEFIFISYCF